MSKRFRDHLRDARETAQQSTEVMSLLMNVDEQDYLKLESGEVRPDEDTLRRLCVLLEWNFYDTRQMLINELTHDTAIAGSRGAAARAGQQAEAAAGTAEGAAKGISTVPEGATAPDNAAPSQRRKSFHALLREEREAAEQTPAVMALLLNVEEEDYQALEQGEVAPDDETLRRMCVMLEWNYYDARQLLINDMAAQRRPPPPQAIARSVPAGMRDTLANRLKVVREDTGQSVEVLAMLMNVREEQYLELEGGGSPTDEQLRRISILYNWNYQDLLSLLRSEHARTLSPRRVGTAYPGASANVGKLHALTQDLERSFASAPVTLQQTVLAQLELIKQTLDAQSATAATGSAPVSLQPRA